MFHQVFVCDSAPEDLKPEEPMDTSQLEQEFQVPIVIKQEEILLSTEETPSEPSFDYGSNVNEDVVLAMETSQPKEERKLSLDTIYTEPAPSIEQHLGSDAKLQTSFVKLTDVKFDKLLSHVMEDKVLLKDLENKFFMDSVDDIKKEEKDPDLGDPNVTYNLVEKIKPEVKTVKTEIVIKEELDSDSMNVEEEDTEDNLANENTEEENLVISANNSSSEALDVDDEDFHQEKSDIQDDNTISCKEQEAPEILSSTELSREEVVKEDTLKRNTFVNIVSKRYKCSKCYFKSATEDSLQVHFENNHLQAEKHVCEMCGEILNSKRSYALHLYTHEGLPTQVSKANHGEVQSLRDQLRVPMKEIHDESKIEDGKTFAYKEEIPMFEDSNTDSQYRIKMQNVTSIICEEQSVVGNVEMTQESVAISEQDLFSHNVLKTFKCSKCYYKSASEDKLRVHYENNHLESEELECEWCCMILTSKRLYDQHQAVHENLNCNGLQTQVFRRFKCRKCNFSAKDRAVLAEHREKEHTIRSESMFKKQCEICGDVLTARLFDRHMSLHKGVKPFKCSECSYTTTRGHYLKTHYKRVHLKISRYTCSECGYKSKCKENMRVHEAIHALPSGAVIPKPYKCLVCGASHISKYNLNAHMKRHELRKCSMCSEMFEKRSRSYSRHLRLAHGVFKEFKCDVCGMIFYYGGAFRNHMQTHGPAKYFCNTCGKGFKSKSNLEQHFIKHSEEKRFTCSQCGEQFKWPQYLISHVAAVHGKPQ